MSKSISKRALSRDWAALHAELKAATQVSPEVRELWLAGKIPDPAPGWGDDYIHALQKSLEGRDHAPLLKMLDAGLPLHPLLLPILAEVIRDAQQGLTIGRSTSLTAYQDRNIRFLFDAFTSTKNYTGKSEIEKVRQWLADTFEVSTDTIKRSLKQTQPKDAK